MLAAARRALTVALALLLGCDGTPPAGPIAGEAAKVLRVTFQAAETAFDPVKVSDYYSGAVIEAIYDSLLTYDYLARPAKLVPNVAEALPVVTDEGRTYTFRLRKGIQFTPDPAFKGAPRDQPAVPHRMQVTGDGAGGIVAAIGGPEQLDEHVVAAASHP